MIRWETFIELTLYFLIIETRQAVTGRAIRGNSISVNSRPPPLLRIVCRATARAVALLSAVAMEPWLQQAWGPGRPVI